MDANQAIGQLVHNFTRGAIIDFILKVKESRYFYCEKSTKVTVDCWWRAVVAMFLNNSGTLDEKLLQHLVHDFRQIWKWMRWTFTNSLLSRQMDPNTEHAQSLEYDWITELNFLAPYIQLGKVNEIDFDLDVGPPGTLCDPESPFNIIHRDPSEPEFTPPCISFRVCGPSGVASNYCEPSTSQKAAELYNTDWYQQISLPTEPDSSPPTTIYQPIAAAMFGCGHTSNEEGSNESMKPCLLVYLGDSTNATTNYCEPHVPTQAAEASTTDAPQFSSSWKAEEASNQQMRLQTEPQIIVLSPLNNTFEPESCTPLGNQNTNTNSIDAGLNQNIAPNDYFLSLQPRIKQRSPGK